MELVIQGNPQSSEYWIQSVSTIGDCNGYNLGNFTILQDTGENFKFQFASNETVKACSLW
jgi:hypothetical protein